MTPELRRMILDRDEVALERAFYDRTCQDFFTVDWREDDADIVKSCAETLGLETLTAEWRDENLFILYEGRETRVPLKIDAGDRHITLCTLNDVLSPGHELRYVVCSHGGDALGFAALSTADWRDLENADADAVAENFLDPRPLRNLITEFNDYDLPAKAKKRHDRMLNRE
jgi:hypothetical protein